MVEMRINGYHTDEPVITLLDEDDYDRFRHWKWQESQDGYARRNRQHTDANGAKRWQTVLLHRAVLGLVGVDTPEECVDHINGNRLDNRKENLRLVSLSENSFSRHTVLSSTGVLCVSRCGNSYIARAQRNREQYYLGSYSTPDQARKAVDNFDQMGRKPDIRKQRKVTQLTPDGEVLKVFGCCADACRETGICGSNIYSCVNGLRKTAGGYVWRYC